MACCMWSFTVMAKPTKSPSPSPSPSPTATALSSSPEVVSSFGFKSSTVSNFNPILPLNHQKTLIRPCLPRNLPNFQVVSFGGEPEPLRVMISGAPASGKGTQCQLITAKYNLVHIAAGDLLRAEISAGSEKGKKAKEYMEKGQLVPNEIVVMMVKDRLLQSDAQENGWLLDGYPRSLSQATALEEFGIQPDIFILLEVSEEALVERVAGRRLDPVTGKIYHLKYSPPETEEIAARLTQRFDDTEEKVKLRLQTHHQNVESVLSIYEDYTVKVSGNASKEDVFAQIDNVLSDLIERKKTAAGPMIS